MKNLLALGFILLAFISNAQRIEGAISDHISGERLLGALVVLNESQASTVTNEEGVFVFDSLAAGLYTIKISYIGYVSHHSNAVWVKNGKTTFLPIGMKEDPLQLDEVTISGLPDIQKVSNVQITEEKINRYAAVYNDPARLVINSPDANISNDQNNQISVRGLSPTLNTWRLQGVEIVNPNHLTNAGTFNDQPAATGGGVNILSAQMLDKSEFLVGKMDNTYSNSTAGMFDMQMRNGYTGDQQFTAQASFIGFDFNAEGPLSKGSKASYIANYRYSFTGLLGLMGVDFNGEKIGFQDLSFNVNMPLKGNGSIKVFGLGGLSKNEFKSKPQNEWEVEKDQSDILYEGKMGALGAIFESPLSSNLKLTLTSLLSASNDSREEIYYWNENQPGDTTALDSDKRIWSNRFNFIWNLGSSNLEFGTSFTSYTYDYANKFGFFLPTQVQVSLNQLSPYLDWKYEFAKNWLFNAGVTHYYVSRDGKTDNEIDYRAALIYNQNKFSATLNYGKYSQIKLPFQSFVRFPNQLDDVFSTFGILTSYRYIASAQYGMKNKIIKLEGFYYDFPEVGELPDENQNFFGFVKHASTYGGTIQFSGQTPLMYFDIAATIFNSTFNNDVDNPYNVQQSYSANFGKKYGYEKKGEQRTFAVNLKGLYQGGLFQLEEDDRYKSQLEPYYRLDLRLQWTRNKTKSTTSWALDIQNLTNRQNEAYQYFDRFTGQVETSYQLGLIPVLTYRVEF